MCPSSNACVRSVLRRSVAKSGEFGAAMSASSGARRRTVKLAMGVSPCPITVTKMGRGSSYQWLEDSHEM